MAILFLSCEVLGSNIYIYYEDVKRVYKLFSSRSRVADTVVLVTLARDSRQRTWWSGRARRKVSWTFRVADTCTQKANVSIVTHLTGWTPWTRTTIYCDWSHSTRSRPFSGWACDVTVWSPSDRTWCDPLLHIGATHTIIIYNIDYRIEFWQSVICFLCLAQILWNINYYLLSH